MAIFLLTVICALTACLAFLVWAFWPVIFQDFRADIAAANRVEAQAAAEFKRAVQASGVAPPAPLPGSPVGKAW